VSRTALAYCAFLENPGISLPAAGVNGAPVQIMSLGKLRLLWAEVEWPFQPEHMQKNAVEFHSVVSHVFKQVAVIPFRLLSVFEDAEALRTFIAEHEAAFVADLERLSEVVQMECVVYPNPAPSQVNATSGAAYLHEKAAKLHAIEQQVQDVQTGLGSVMREVRVREAKSGTRIFVLTERGRAAEFRTIIERVPLPAQLARRVSGPWPAAEFLSEEVRAPQVASAK